jgi:hypothetical protein
VLIRRESTGDAEAIRAVTVAAFDRIGRAYPPAEARLVDELRASPAWLPALSLVAIDAAGNVAGHQWEPHFQVRLLSAYQPGLRGTFAYPEPFDRV